jgi:protein-disulfide isomerase
LLAVSAASELDAATLRQISAQLPPPSIGPDDAPVTLRDFVDLNCSHCVESITRLRAITGSYDGRVRLELFHFPGNSDCNEYYPGDRGNSQACASALAVVAAFLVGETYEERNANYWAMVDETMRRFGRPPGLMGLDWSEVAEKVGIDRAAFDAVAGSDRVEAYLLRDTNLGGRIPIVAFPTVILDDQVLERGVSDEAIRALIEARLAEHDAAADPPGAPADAADAAP